MKEIIPLLMGILAAYFLFSGFSRIIRRRATSTRWRYEPPHLAVREEVEITGFWIVLSRIIRLMMCFETNK